MAKDRNPSSRPDRRPATADSGKPATPTDGLRVVNQPVQILRGFPREIASLWTQRDLMRAMVSREFRVRYKGARLGWLWALVKPLVMLFIYALAVGVFLGAGRTTPDFAIYLYLGLITWGLFTQIVLGSINGVIGNADLIRKAAFPRELIVVAVAAVALIDLALQAAVLPIGYLYYRDLPQWGNLWWSVPGILLALIFGLAVGMFLAALNSRYRDIGFVTDVGLQVGFWLVPVIYTYAAVSASLQNYQWAARAMLYNPLTVALFGMREALWPPSATSQGVPLAFPGPLGTASLVLICAGLVMLFLAHRYFVRRASNMAEEL